MSGTQSLIQAFESGVLTQPRHDLPNLVDLARAIAKLSGVCDLDLSPSAAEVAAKIGESDHLVLVMADGVGMNLVESMPRSSFLPKRLQDELLTVFPSTTSVALTSLTTGEWPVRHAITGWWTHLPDLGSAATILQYTARNGGPRPPRARHRPQKILPGESPSGPPFRRTRRSSSPSRLPAPSIPATSAEDAPPSPTPHSERG